MQTENAHVGQGGIKIRTSIKAVAIAVLAAMLLSSVPAETEECGMMLSASAVGSGTQSNPYVINMLAGDTFEYTLSTNLNANFSVTSGNLAIVGLALNGDTISGTASVGKETVCVTASSAEGPAQAATQWITFNVYNVLAVSGTILPSWAGQEYSIDITVSDVDPDNPGETVLTLNQAASQAGYTISKVSETSWTLSRSSESNIAGNVDVIITAATSAGGISQTKKLTSTITTYETVGFSSTPSDHQGSGLTVWLIQGDGSWEYTPQAVPEGAVISASNLPSGVTFTNGKLTVSKENVMDSASVVLTASSSAGGSERTANQTLTVKVWNRLDYETASTVSNIKGTVDGRTYSASVVAANYSSIVWDMGDGTVYNNVTSVSHEYKDAGLYTVRVTVSDERGQSLSTSSAVHIASEEDPVTPDKQKKESFDSSVIAAVAALIGGIIATIGGYFRNKYAAVLGIVIMIAGIAAFVYFIW